MINIKIENAGALTERETTALAMLFMHLGGHQLQPVSATQDQEPLDVKETLAMDKFNPVEDTQEDELIEEELIPVPAEKVEEPFNPFKDVPFAPPHNSSVRVPIPSVPAPSASVPAPSASVVPPPATRPSIHTEKAEKAPEYDSVGIRWDERIHAKNKSQTSKGEWKLGRNIPQDMIRMVMGELKTERNQRVNSSVAAPNPAFVTPPPVNVPVPPAPSVNVPVPPPAPYVQPAPMLPLVDLTPPQMKTNPVMPPFPDGKTHFDLLVEKVTNAITDKKITVQQVLSVVHTFKNEQGVPLAQNLMLLRNYPHIVPAVDAEINKILGA